MLGTCMDYRADGQDRYQQSLNQREDGRTSRDHSRRRHGHVHNASGSFCTNFHADTVHHSDRHCPIYNTICLEAVAWLAKSKVTEKP